MPAPTISALDCCDCSTKLAKAFNGRELTVDEFDVAMTRFAAEKRRTGSGGYSKLRGVFTFGTESIEFRIDVDAEMKEGRTLAKLWAARSRFFSTEQGIETARIYGNDPAEMAELYKSAAFACL